MPSRRRGENRCGQLRLTGCVILLLFTAGGESAPPPPESRDLAAKVAGLLVQLDADLRGERTAAERELLDLGPALLPHLPAPELLPSAGVRATVARIRVQLERRQALESVLPARVTFAGKRTLSELLQAIAGQSGNSLAFAHLPEDVLKREFEVDFQSQPFWEALDGLARRAALRYDFDKSVSCVWLASRETAASDEAAVTHAGAFRLSVTEARLRPVFGGADQRQLRMTMTLFAEPRLRPLFLKFAAQEISVLAGEKRLPARSPAAKYDLPLAEGRQPLRWTLDFVAPSAGELAPVTLSGRIHVELAAGRERIRFRNLSAAGVARRRGGVTVTLQRATSKPAANRDLMEASLPVNVMYDTGGPAFESHRTWVFHNEAYLEDADGRQLNPSAYDTVLQRDGIVGVTYRFTNLPGRLANYEFVYVAPTLIVDVPVEFSIPAIPVAALEADGEAR